MHTVLLNYLEIVVINGVIEKWDSQIGFIYQVTFIYEWY